MRVEARLQFSEGLQTRIRLLTRHAPTWRPPWRPCRSAAPSLANSSLANSSFAHLIRAQLDLARTKPSQEPLRRTDPPAAVDAFPTKNHRPDSTFPRID